MGLILGIILGLMIGVVLGAAVSFPIGSAVGIFIEKSFNGWAIEIEVVLIIVSIFIILHLLGIVPKRPKKHFHF